MPTPVYSAFTLIAIESIWPSANGDEIPINYLDLSYLGENFGQFERDNVIGDKKSKSASLRSEVNEEEEDFVNFLSNPSNLSAPYTYYSYEFSENENGDNVLTITSNGSLGDSPRDVTSNDFQEKRQKNLDLIDIIKNYMDDISSYQSENESGDNLPSLGFDVLVIDGRTITESAYQYQTEFSGILAGDRGINESSYNKVKERYSSLQEKRADLAFVESEIDSLSGGEYVTSPKSTYRPGFSSIFNSEDAIKQRRGYFKIIPLNVISASTSVGTGGSVGESSFSVNFTLDEVLLVADSYTAGSSLFNSILPRAIPIGSNSIDDELERIFGQSIPDSVVAELTPYGSSIYRISANDFPFNIEDLVEANDTVTVWMYHDPKEFDIVPKGSVESFSNDFLYNKDFSYVIGTGSRKSQDDFKLLNSSENIPGYSPPRSYVQSVLNDSEVLSDFLSPGTLSSFSGDNPEEITVENVSLEDSFDFIIAAGNDANFLAQRSTEGFNVDLERGSAQNATKLERLAYSILPNSDQTYSLTSFFNAIDLLYLVDLSSYSERVEKVSNVSEFFGYEGNGNIPANLLTYRSISNSLVTSIREIVQDQSLLNTEDRYQAWKNLPSSKLRLENIPIPVTLISFYTEAEIKEIFDFLENFRTPLTNLINESLKFLSYQNQIEISTTLPNSGSEEQDGFFNKRKIIVSKSHGETPYLAIKGHIDSIQTRYGASSGSYSVSVQGRGYDKILSDNEVYYEDLYSPTGGSFAQTVEGYPKYSQMLPPKAILNFIEANVPRFIVVGQPSAGIIDAKNMSLYFATQKRTQNVDEEQNEETEEDTATVLEAPEVKGVLDKYFPDGSVLIRGLSVVSLNSAGDFDVNEDGEISNQQFDPEGTSIRIFYPVNYLNTSRIQEMINSLETVYEKNPEDAVIRVPITIKSQESVANNVLTFNGPKEINHMFVDETGRFRQRMAFEAWERTPRPEYIPTITDNELLASGSSFSRDSSRVLTMVDVRPNYFGTGSGITDALFSGRTLSSANDYIPVTSLSKNDSLGEDADNILYSDFYGAVSEEFFRYGLRYQLVNDIYTTSTNVAKRKSILYHGFFSKPIKSASLTLKNNTSYRAGETVLVNLNRYKHRSKEIIDINKTINWLTYLRDEEPDLIPLYIGVDRRWLDNDSYYLTNSDGAMSNYTYWLNDFKRNPEEFVINMFIDTLKFISTKMTTSYKVMTPEYFPTTWWAFNKYGDQLSSRFSSTENIKNIYSDIYTVLISKNKAVNFRIDSPDVLNSVRLQNFKCTSYYIDSVSHEYLHGENFTTSLNLTHGQDNIVLIEPFSMRPIGFMSIEKRMRIGYDDVVVKEDGNTQVYQDKNLNTHDRLLWEDFDSKEKSAMQNMYIEQYRQDNIFKNNSFLYQSQKNRNSANFMYDIALDLGLAD